ncbi:MAG: acyltransferase [Rhodothermales bacterium]|nr:acyltransferase [Rhodothermales bacterium]
MKSPPTIRDPDRQEDVPTGKSIPKQTYNYAFGYLRGFATILVLAHHALLAYHPYAPEASADMLASRWWQAFPVLDEQRAAWAGVIVSFNDIFVMALMFFISGLFVWGSLKRKRVRPFLRDRSRRLGIPFVAVAVIVTPLAYYPAYLLSGSEPGLAGYWSMWSQLGNWPAGPAWFLWMLLAFGATAAALFIYLPKWVDSLGKSVGSFRHPRTFFFMLFAVSGSAYLWLGVGFGADHWSSIGPFAFQTGRLPFYLMYFLFGMAFGAYGLEHSILRQDGALARSWHVWFAIALAVFVGHELVETMSYGSSGNGLLWGAARLIFFVASAAASSLFFLAVFLRFANKPRKLLDSLDQNAYGMYLIHYPFASWIPWVMLDLQLPAGLKAIVAIVATVALSWISTSLLRRIGPVGRII